MTIQVLVAMLLGAIAGSFSSTWAVRIERGGSVARGRSSCDRCGGAVPAWANIPIASYVVLRGRCAACGGTIDRRHFLLEIVDLIIAAASVATHPGLAGWAGAVFGWLLAALAVVDARQFRLPDVLVLPLFGLGLIGGVCGVAPSIVDRVFGATGGFLALTLLAITYRVIRCRAGIGRGDIKLLAAIGAWIGWRPLPWVVMIAAALGVGWAGCRVVRGQQVKATDRMPLGTLLASAAWPYWLLFH